MQSPHQFAKGIAWAQVFTRPLAWWWFSLALLALPTLAVSQCYPKWNITGFDAQIDGYIGTSVSKAGDIDGDGFGDILIGGVRPNTLYDDGRVVILSGRTHKLIRKHLGPYRRSYDDYSDDFGVAVAGGGDANGDGVPDVAVGSDWYPTLGPVPDSVGYGRVYLFSGANGDTIHLFDGVGHGSEFGSCLAFVGDVDGDGDDDLLIGSSQYNAAGYQRGLLYAYSGHDGSLLYKLAGTKEWGWFGCSVAPLGDLDGDSVPDFIVGAYGASEAHVISGRTGVEIYRVGGRVLSDRFGISVASLGDIDHDGCADIAIGAPADDSAGAYSGRAYIYSGRTGTEIFRFAGRHRTDAFGRSVASAGDMDRDGTPDILIGAVYADKGSPYEPGQAYVYSGRTSNLMFVFAGTAASGRFGSSAANVGDLNRDGYSEVAVCADAHSGIVDGVWYPDIGKVYTYSPCQVEADVVPGQCPNYVSMGDDLNVLHPTTARVRAAPQLTAAFVGSGTLDVSTIDPKSALLEGVAPISWEIQDVTAPSWTKESPCDCSARGPDGYPDLVLHFDLAAINTATHKPSILSQSDAVNLTALLKTGEPIIGRDCLRINPLISILAGVGDSVESDQITLSNAPNPFNAATTISYRLPEPGTVRLDVFDVLGRHVVTLVDAAQSEGMHEAVWEGRSEYGETAASGVYLYRLQAGQSVVSKKMILLK